jgi:hypothetical protein
MRQVAKNVETHALAADFHIRSVAGLNSLAPGFKHTNTLPPSSERCSLVEGQPLTQRTPERLPFESLRERVRKEEAGALRNLAGDVGKEGNAGEPEGSLERGTPVCDLDEDKKQQTSSRPILKLHDMSKQLRMSVRQFELETRARHPEMLMEDDAPEPRKRQHSQNTRSRPHAQHPQYTPNPRTARQPRNPHNTQNTGPPEIPRNRKISSYLLKADSSAHLLSPQSRNQYCRFLQSMPENGTLTIRVVDTGCGMTESDRHNLFTCYKQANKKVQSKFGGTGLGLWLCKELLHAMKGDINCISAPNQGSTFIVTLPLQCKSTASTQEHTSQSPLLFKGFKAVCYLKNMEEVEGPLKKLGCDIIPCDSLESLLGVLRVRLVELSSCSNTRDFTSKAKSS